MTLKPGKEGRQRVLISSIILIIIVGLTLVVLAISNKKSTERAFESLREAALNSDDRMTAFVEDTFYGLECIASSFTNRSGDVDSSDFALNISHQHIGSLNLSTRVYFPDGVVYADGEAIENLSYDVDFNYILSEMKDNRGISNCKADYLFPEMAVMEFYVPIIRDDKPVAILSAILDVNKLRDYMGNNLFGGQSDVFFLDLRDGTFFVDTFHGKIDTTEVLVGRRDKDGNSIMPFVEGLRSGKETYTTLKSQSTGETLYMYAVPSQIDNWVSVIAIDQQIAFADSISARKLLLSLSGAEILVFLIYVFWMLGSVKKQAISESKNLVSQMMDDDSLFLINCASDTRKTIYSRGIVRDEYSDEEKYSHGFSRYVNTHVAETDREMMELMASPQYLLERTKKEKEFSIIYRDLAVGVQRFYEMKIARLSDTEVLQSFNEKDKEIVDKLVFDKIKDDYFALFCVDLDAGYYNVLKKSPWYKAGEVGTVLPYTSSMVSFANSLEGDAKDFFLKISNIDFLKQRFETDDKATFVYNSPFVDGTRWVNVTGIVLTRNQNGEPSLLGLAFNVLDGDASEVQEIQTRLKEDMQMIAGLASEYHTLYYLNIDKGIFKIYSMDGKRFPELKPFFTEGSDPLVMLRNFGQSDLIHPDDRNRFNEIDIDFVRERLAHSKKYTVRFRRDFGGEYLWTEMDIIKYEDIDERADIVAVGFAVRDAEIRREQSRQQELEDAKIAADAANKAKSNFLFSMSHDIRTPMNVITGFTTLAKKYIDDKNKVAEYLDKIDISGQQLLMLINQVLEMARIEKGQMTLSESPVNIMELYNGMIAVFCEQAESCGLTLTGSIENITHCDVLADEARMSSVAYNVVGNAIKYTPEGGKIDVRFTEKECNKPGYASYVFSVTDTGIGMSDEFLKIIYEPFSREKSSTVSKVEGTGLGMAIVKNLIDLLDGKIEVKSELGKGTRFDISVDLKIDTNKQTKENVMDPTAIRFEGRSILVVEDNEMNREITKAILEARGFNIEEAEDGDVAVDMVKNHEMPYDCILMDIQMPRMNGYEATKAIKAILDERKEYVPVIAMTANAFEEDRQNAIEAGLDEHITKPINVRLLLETIAKLLR